LAAHCTGWTIFHRWLRIYLTLPAYTLRTYNLGSQRVPQVLDAWRSCAAAPSTARSTRVFILSSTVALSFLRKKWTENLQSLARVSQSRRCLRFTAISDICKRGPFFSRSERKTRLRAASYCAPRWRVERTNLTTVTATPHYLPLCRFCPRCCRRGRLPLYRTA